MEIEETFDLGTYGQEIYDLVPLGSGDQWPGWDSTESVMPGDQRRTLQHEATELIVSSVPAGARLIWVSENPLGRRDISGYCQVFPFLERDGEYWGLPSDDEMAIRELERMRQGGAEYIIFDPPVYWWLDYYGGFYHHLRPRYARIVENHQIVVFNLDAP